MSLTSPADKTEKWKASSDPPLSDVDADNAVKDLVVPPIANYPKLERMYADPVLMNQKFTLVSFIPSKTAKPDKDGIYGMIKVRGTFATEDEANARAEYLIKNVDSYNKIYHTFTGRPFPATSSSKFSHATTEIDIRNKIRNIVSDNVKKQKDDENQVIDEIKDREKLLLEESKRNQNNEPEDPIETYTMHKVKYAQLVWTYKETQKKMEEYKKIIIKTREQVEKTESDNPDFEEKYMEKYTKAREDAGLTEDNENSFMKYLCEDIELDF